jgi:choline dehydrogenase-like flavoprotein
MDYKEVHGSGVQHSPRRMAARSDICAALAPCCHSSERTGPVDSTIADNQRASAARCYLHPVLTRPNLKVITKAIASRVLVKRGRAVGVEYIKNGQVHALRAEREVILSGGAINSPQLLQLSGIGDGDHLRSLGIKVVHELKGGGAESAGSSRLRGEAAVYPAYLVSQAHKTVGRHEGLHPVRADQDRPRDVAQPRSDGFSQVATRSHLLPIFNIFSFP